MGCKLGMLLSMSHAHTGDAASSAGHARGCAAAEGACAGPADCQGTRHHHPNACGLQRLVPPDYSDAVADLDKAGALA